MSKEGVVSVDKTKEDGGKQPETQEDDFEESLFSGVEALPESGEPSMSRFQAEAMASAPELLPPEDGLLRAGLLRRHSAGQPPLAPATSSAPGPASSSGKGGRAPMSSLTLAGLDLDEEALANAAPLHMHTMLIPSRLSVGGSVGGGGTPPTGRSRSSSRGASRSVSPARAATPTGVASATATTVSTVTSHPVSPLTAPPVVLSAGGAGGTTLTASNLAKLAATAGGSGETGPPPGGYSAPASVAGDVASSSGLGVGAGVASSAASSVGGDFGVPSSSASAPAFGNTSASNLNLWEVSSTNATIDPDIFLDTKGLDDLEPPGEITIGGGSFSSLHGSFSGSALPSVVERASEETLEDFRAFCDVVPSSHTSASSVSGSSVAGGSVAGDASCILETLEEEDDDLLDEDDEDDDRKLRAIHQTLVEEQDEDFDDDFEDDLHRRKSQQKEDDDVAAVIKGVLSSMLVVDPKSEEASIPNTLMEEVAGSVVRQGSLSKALPRKEAKEGKSP